MVENEENVSMDYSNCSKDKGKNISQQGSSRQFLPKGSTGVNDLLQVERMIISLFSSRHLINEHIVVMWNSIGNSIKQQPKIRLGCGQYCHHNGW